VEQPHKQPDTRTGWARVWGALWFIVAAVVAVTVFRVDPNHYRLPLLFLTAGVPGLIVAFSVRIRPRS